MFILLRQLEFLIGVAELGSISACAEHFGMSQPSVTYQIHRLEKELGSTLLIRTARGASLTDSGDRIVLQAHRVLKEVNRIPVMIKQTNQGLHGKIVLGVSPLLAIHHLPHIYSRFTRDFPEVEVELVEVNACHLTQQIHKNRVDVGLIPLPLSSLDVPHEQLWTEELVVISTIEQGLGDFVTMRALGDYNFVAMQPGHSLNLTVNRLAQEAGFQPHVTSEASGIHSLIGFVASGIGIAIVPKETAIVASRSSLIHVSHLLPMANRQLAMAYPRANQLSPATEVFMDYIRWYAKSRQEDGLGAETQTEFSNLNALA